MTITPPCDDVSGYAMEWASDAAMDAHLDAATRSVLLGLAYWANRKSGWAWVSVPELMTRTGLGRNRILRALAAIEASGVVGVVRRPGRTAKWGPFPTLGHISNPSHRGYGSSLDDQSTRPTGGTTGRPTGGTGDVLPGVHDPKEITMNKPSVAATLSLATASVAATKPKPAPPSTWHPTMGPTVNRSADPDDHDPPEPGLPPAKADLQAVMFELSRQTLGRPRTRTLEDR